MYDITTLKAKIDLREFAAQLTTLEAKSKKESAGPCPICGGTDRFSVQKERWLCRTCTNGQWRDLVHLAALVWGMDSQKDFRAICDKLGADLSPHQGTTAQVIPEPDDDNPPPQDWQKVVKGLALHFESVLWSQDGEQARAWLNRRGLYDDTLRLFGIGYNPTSQKIAGHWVYNGIIIPHLQASTGTLWGVKIRLGAEGRQTWLRIWQQNNPEKDPASAKIPKYISIGGSRQNLFNVDSLTGKQSAFICEGEFDTMLLEQQAVGLVGVVTLGSCSAHLGQRWLPALLPVSRFYLALDNDRPGRSGLLYWKELLGRRGVVAEVPTGKDITEYHQAGGDLREWVKGFEIERAF